MLHAPIFTVVRTREKYYRQYVLKHTHEVCTYVRTSSNEIKQGDLIGVTITYLS